jgi:glycosyltransferase involved in cell wall biosynthesis
MIISFVYSKFPTRSEVFAINNIKYFADQGHICNVYTARSTNSQALALLEEFSLSNVTILNPRKILNIKLVFSIPCYYKIVTLFLRFLLSHCNDFNSFIKPLSLLPLTLRIYKDFKILQPNILHVYWGHYYSIIGFAIKNSFPKIIVTTSLGAYDLRSNYLGSLELCKKSDHVRVLSSFDKNILKSKGIEANKISVIYDGVNVAKYESLRTIKKNSNQIISVGRLDPNKNFQEVIKIFNVLIHNNKHLKLIIIGEGPFRKNLEKLVNELGLENKIKLVGALSHFQTMELIASSRLFLFLSNIEKIPNVIKESMAVGTPCISSNTDAIEELITDQNDGYIVNVENTSQIVSIIEKLLNNESLYDFIRINGFEKVNLKFNLQIECEKFLDIWNR